VSTKPQDDPPLGRGGLWHRLWTKPSTPKSGGEPESGSNADIHIRDEQFTPHFDGNHETDTADLTQSAPTESMDPPSLVDVQDIRRLCPQCHALVNDNDTYCGDCGFVIPRERPAAKATPIKVEPAPHWHERFQPEEPLPSRPSVQRWRAIARKEPGQPEVEVFYSLSKEPAPPPESTPDDDMVNLQAPLKQMNLVSAPIHANQESIDWPGAKWVYRIIQKLPDKLPQVREYTEEGPSEILVLDKPNGMSLWDAWDHAATLSDRFRWMREIAELLRDLHQFNVVMEALRPEMFVVDTEGHVRINDLSEMLPLPVPSTAQMKGALSTAPELVLAPELADAKVDLYPFGALIYALHHGRELTDLDFDAYGVPRSFVSIFPDGHPVFTQVVLKTFTRFVEARFPSQDDDSDHSGFNELINQLRAGEKSSCSLRFDISGWSSTGLARATNEDAFAFYHATGYQEDHWGDQALILLADGMGGCNAGEVASSMALSHIRESLCSKSTWSAFQNGNPSKVAELNRDELMKEMHEAIQQANASIHGAAEQGDGTQIGMGCTCEAAYLVQGRLFMGHVGDSRAYLYREGSIRQLTQDQTLVNRMVTMGVIKPEEAENHPRRHELDQALGSSHPVEVELITEKLYVGDALLFCSDGLTTHVTDRNISEVLRNTASAEAAARRLVNLANALGGSDNVTVVVVRVA
jgi:serine/threonine protein phosphatase PrpC